MSLGAFAASLSGLRANQQKLSVIGNNLANINTVAFKASNVDFADLVSQSVGGPSINPMQIGLGVTAGEITPNFSQGGIESTGVATNVAIQGGGFFIVGDSTNRMYTRAGNFTFDSSGALVTPGGQNCTRLHPDRSGHRTSRGQRRAVEDCDPAGRSSCAGRDDAVRSADEFERRCASGRDVQLIGGAV